MSGPDPDGLLMAVEVTSYDGDTDRRDRQDKPNAYAAADIWTGWFRPCSVRVPAAQPSRMTVRRRVAKASGVSTNPVWPPGNVVGSVPSA